MDFFGSCLYLNIAAVVEGWNGRRTQSLAGVSGQKDVMSSVKVQLLTLCSCKLTLTCVCGCKPGWSQSLMHFHLWQDLLSAGILPLYLLCASAKDSLQFWHWIRMCVCDCGWKPGLPYRVVWLYRTKMNMLICSQTTGASYASRFGKLLPAVSSPECRFPALNVHGESAIMPVGLKLPGSLIQSVETGSLLHSMGSSVATSGLLSRKTDGYLGNQGEQHIMVNYYLWTPCEI